MSNLFDTLQRAWRAIKPSGAGAPAVADRPAGILLVEDDVRVRRLLRDRLVAAGHRIVEAGTGWEALEVFETAPPALVITDLRLPGMHGGELIERMREHNPAVRVIAISGDLEGDVPALLMDAADRGAVRTLAKPFTTSQLLAAVAAALAP
jgi:CheY-like chemotaxis protein